MGSNLSAPTRERDESKPGSAAVEGSVSKSVKATRGSRFGDCGEGESGSRLSAQGQQWNILATLFFPSRANSIYMKFYCVNYIYICEILLRI